MTDSLSNPWVKLFWGELTTTDGVPQVWPSSVDVLTVIPFRPVSSSKTSAASYSRPSGPYESHTSLARSKLPLFAALPPEQVVNGAQEVFPLTLDHATNPCAPPSFGSPHRSRCHATA